VIRLHRSNRAEELAAGLARVLAVPPGDPFARECLVVQRRGMERWLELQLADAHGICAGVDFLFPRRFLRERLFGPLLGVDVEGPEAFEPARLTWAIAALLPGLSESPAFAEVARYLSRDRSDRRLLALSRRIAEVFDDYAIYRPELVRGWERGAEPEDWQACLWRALVERQGGDHSAALVERARAELARADLDPALLPERVCVFGLSSLPPLFASALGALARRCTVHVFALVPARLGAARHPLVASLGRIGLDLQRELESHGPRAVEESWVDPPEARGRLLGRLQAGLLAGAQVREAVPPDDSISLHSCHGAMREAEVVRDQILAALDADPSLRAHDVAILTPDVARYGPLLEAVFASHEGPVLRVSVADRPPRDADALAQALEAVVDLARGRASSAEVMDLLARDGVRERFGIAAADLEALRAWVERAGIRWGVDEAHRAAEGQPRLAQNTWRRGLERLLLGWAAGEAGRLGDVIGEPSTAAAPTELLGRFAEFCETLFELRERLRGERAPEAWSRELERVMERLLRASGADAAEQPRRLRGALERVAQAARLAGFERAILLDAFWPEVLRALGDAGHAPTHAFLSGAIPVCELVPMRSIPFRVLALVGLGDDAFPRRDARADFDRMAREHRPGDPSRRDEDRQLFLEALLSARDRLILTWTGRSARDGGELAPSVVVDELLDALALDRERFPVVHPLHPFSARYFSGEDPRLFSYDARAQRAREAARGGRALPLPFIEGPLPPEPEPLSELALDELERFLRHPVRWFCQRRLGLHLGAEDEPLEEREPLELGGIERWHIGSALLAARAAGGDPAAQLERARLRGDLPPGRLGERTGAEILRDAEHRWSDVLCAGRDRAAGAVELDRELDRVRLRGRLGGLDSDGTLVALQFGALGHAREVGIWARHVVANALLGPRRTLLFGQGEPSAVRFEPVSAARSILSEWLRWLDEGRRRPLPLYCGAAREYAERRRAGKSRADALAGARREFTRPGSGDRPAGEAFDPYVALAARGRDPLDAGFEELAWALFEPLLAHREAGP
jgi:exodeoxyribonuclease V gamma subunit